MSRESEAVVKYRTEIKKRLANYRKSQEKGVIRYEASFGQALRRYEDARRRQAGKDY